MGNTWQANYDERNIYAYIYDCYMNTKNKGLLAPLRMAQFIGTQWRHMATLTWVSVDPANGLLPDGTAPLFELMQINHQMRYVEFTREQFCKRCSWT